MLLRICDTPANSSTSRLVTISKSRQLIAQAEGGDPDALDRLFAGEASRLRRLLRLHAGPTLLARTELEDLMQEAYLEAVRLFDRYTYQGPDSFFRWLAAIARNRMQNIRRSAEADKRDVRKEIRFSGPKTSAITGGPSEQTTCARSPGPRTLSASSEEVDRLEVALHGLSPQDREVVMLARIEGLSLDQVAERMNRTRNAVALLLSRALRKLSRSL